MTSAFDTLQTYNGMDTIATLEIWEKLLKQLDSNTTVVYNRALALQAPALEMSLRGFSVDPNSLQSALASTEEHKSILLRNWDYICNGLLGRTFLISSWQQLQDLFYSRLGYPEIKVSQKGVSRVSTNSEALEKLKLLNPELTPLVDIILAYRTDLTRLRVYKSGIEHDTRLSLPVMRASFGIASTKTGRWNSFENPFGFGTNLQNIPPDARHVFVAAPGKKLAYIDKEQAESRATALYAFRATGLRNYLDACISGDLHTYVAKMVWKNDIPWTGDPTKDKELAERPYYRGLSYRDMCKKIGHGTNYYGKAFTISRQTRVPQKLVQDFQDGYLQEFPEIGLYHRHTIRDLQLNKRLITLHNRVRHFFGRLDDDATFREAIAYLPQSVICDDLNISILRLFAELPEVDLLAQIHDAVIIQYPEEEENSIIPKALDCIQNPLVATYIDPKTGEASTISHIVPSSVETGWNWGKASSSNPGGLKKWREEDDRQRPKFSSSIFDITVS